MRPPPLRASVWPALWSLLALACEPPLEVPPAGPDLSEAAAAYLIDWGGGPRILRLRSEGRLQWSALYEQTLDLELWTYGCREPLPVEVTDWGPLPECLPPPALRLRLNEAKTGWEPTPSDTPHAAPICDVCTQRPTVGVQLDLPASQREGGFGAATWIDDQSALVVVHPQGNEPPLSTLFWIGPTEVRALEVELPAGRTLPRLGAVGRSGQDLIAVGDGVWRLSLEPSSTDVRKVVFSLESDTTTTAEGLERAHGGVFEAPWGATLLASGNGGLYRRTGGPLLRLEAARTPVPNVRDGHAVSFARFDADQVIAVGPGSQVSLDEGFRVRMTHYLVLRADRAPEPRPLPMLVLPLATVAHREQVYVLDRTGTLWRLKDVDQPQLVQADLLNEGWLGYLGDRLLVTGKNGSVQALDPAVGRPCPSTSVTQAATILSGEQRALLVADEAQSVTWVTDPFAAGCGP